MKTLRFIAIIVLSAVVALVIGLGVLYMTGSGRAFGCVFFFGAIFMALLLGAFDIDARKSTSRFDSIKHKVGYRKAA